MPEPEQKFFISEDDAFVRQKLIALLETYDLGAACDVLDGDGGKRFPAPVRAGFILDHVLAQSHANDIPATVVIGPYIFDFSQQSLYEQGSSEVLIRLTEKEAALLQVLLEKKDVPVSREDLLDCVWAYAPDVETHTLETHIYRLRQKIEKDPSNPSILVTKDDGYTLK